MLDHMAQVILKYFTFYLILFGENLCLSGVDVWAVGCILAELLLRIPFVAGDTDLDQLAKIFQAMGTPTEESWPGHSKLPDYVQFRSYPATPLEDIFTAAAPDLIDLMSSMLNLDPMRRCKCSEGLKMPYFSNNPAPTPGPNLPMPSSLSSSTSDKDTTSDLNVAVPGSKRKLREGLESSGLAKKLVF